MKLRIIIAAVCLFVFVKVPSASPETNVGPAKFANCECSGVTVKGPKENKTQRKEFRLTCKRTEFVKNEEKKDRKKEIVWQTSCSYGGDPSPCKEYKEQKGKFYQGLLNVMAADYCDEILRIGQCKDVGYNAHKICKDIKFTLNK